MKNINKILFLGLFTLCFNKVIAQLDTLNYLKQFEANKTNYIGQPFSKLLNDMTQIQPKTVWSLNHGRHKTFILGNRFKFSIKEFSFNNAITLSVTWQDNIPIEQFNYYGKKNQYYFTNEERAFYGNKIVKDIMVYR